MTESTVHTQRVYAVSKPSAAESSVVHTQRVYAVSQYPNEASVVHTQRVYIVSYEPQVVPEVLEEIDPGTITLVANNSTSISQSPFTYKQQVFKHPGERWEAEIVIPSTRRGLAQYWASKLVQLRGKSVSVLLGDPDHATPVGTATSMTVSGNAGDDTITVNSLDGTLLAGDHFQLGSGSDSRLHMVLVDKSSGSGTLEIWPALRTNYSSASATLSNPKGTFRLASNVTEWSINNASIYGISFSAVEDLT